MVAAAVVNSVRTYLENLIGQGIPVYQGVIFGSQVHGRADQWSDIDLLVISERFDQNRSRADINLLWRVAARTDNRIEPIPVGRRQFDEDTTSPIIELARREGQVVSLKN